jgi:hypothetical protein
MAPVLLPVLVVALAAFAVSVVLGIASRNDPARRRRYNGWLLASAVVSMLCLLPFMFGWA